MIGLDIFTRRRKPVADDLGDARERMGQLFEGEFVDQKAETQLMAALNEVDLASINNLVQIHKLSEVVVPKSDPELSVLAFIYSQRLNKVQMLPVMRHRISEIRDGDVGVDGLRRYHYVVTETKPDLSDKSQWAKESEPKIIIQFLGFEEEVGESDFSQEALEALQSFVQNHGGPVLGRKLGFVFRDFNEPTESK